MSQQPFDLALAFTLPAEGGYVNDADDAGGATNRGVTQAVYDTYRDIVKLPRQGVQLMTDAETTYIYRMAYWEPGKCAQLPAPLAIAHFDWCVNHGVSGAIKTLQQVLDLPQDGQVGPATLAAVSAANPSALTTAYIDARADWYRARVVEKPSQQKFLDGWLARCGALNAFITKHWLEFYPASEAT